MEYTQPDGVSDSQAEYIKKLLEEQELEASSQMETVNIVVAGSSGVGKSTLINSVFGRQLAEVGTGKPTTMKIEKLTSPPLPLCLYDTRGLEIGDSASTIEQLKSFITKLRSDTVAEEQIHVVWLCLLEASNRFEPIHSELLTLFRGYKIPCIVVLTQSQGNDEFLEQVKTLAGPVAAIVQVMAAPLQNRFTNIPVHGLDTLVDQTMRVLPEARAEAFNFCQKANWNLKVGKARTAINVAAAAAGGSAVIPIPGGHSAACIAIDSAMLVAINRALGLSFIDGDGRSVVVGLIGVVGATVGGKMAFAEAIKFIPAVGWVTGAVIGGTIAGTVTKALGELYLDVAGELARNDKALPKADILIQMLKTAFEQRRSRYMGDS